MNHSAVDPDIVYSDFHVDIDQSLRSSNSSVLSADTASFIQTSSIIEGINIRSELQTKLLSSKDCGDNNLQKINYLKNQISQIESKRDLAIMNLDKESARMVNENGELLRKLNSIPRLSELQNINKILHEILNGPMPSLISVSNELILNGVIENGDNIPDVLEGMYQELQEIPSTISDEDLTSTETDLQRKIDIMKLMIPKTEKKSEQEIDALQNEICQLQAQLHSS